MAREPLNKSSAERVAVKIGMITRRVTQVVACAFTCMAMPRSATKWHSRASPEGPVKRDGGRIECHDRGPACPVGASIPLRGRIFLRKILLLSPRSHHSRRRPSRISSCKATVAPTRDLFSDSLSPASIPAVKQSAGKAFLDRGSMPQPVSLSTGQILHP